MEGSRVWDLGFRIDQLRIPIRGLGYSRPEVDRIWLGVYYSMPPIYSIFYLLKGDCIMFRAWAFALTLAIQRLDPWAQSLGFI